MSEDLLRAAFRAIPSFAFVVDRDIRIQAANTAALTLAGASDEVEVTLRRGGDVLECTNSTLSPGGCGCADACRKCVLRNSVTRCIDTHSVVRGKTRFQRTDSSGSRDAFFLVTATPFESGGGDFALLFLDDLGEQIKVRGILPVCAYCHRVRNESNEWEDVDRYVSSSLALDWSHGICEPCLDKHHPA